MIKEERESKYVEKSVEEKYCILTKTLTEKKFMITTMDSAISGQIASLITDTEGEQVKYTICD